MNINNNQKYSDSSLSSFKLLRVVAVAALLVVIFMGWLLGSLYEKYTEEEFHSDAKIRHIEIVRLYRNFIWPIYGDYLLSINDQSIPTVFNNASYQDLNNSIVTEINDSRVLGFKIFNADGLTVYSSIIDQIGINKKGYPGFETAIRGDISSKFKHSYYNNEFESENSSLQTIYSSYIPVYNTSEDIKAIAVMELYSDVTDLVEKSERHKNRLIAITVGILLILYCLLIIMLKSIERRLKNQEKSHQKIHEDAIRLANHDVLTGLPNRSYFNEVFNDRLPTLNTANPLLLMFIDLDSFKPINDNHGHQTGDMVLKLIAKRIQNAINEESLVARVGGDEFIVISELNTTQHSKSCEAMLQAQTILNNLEKPIILDEDHFLIGASIGITICDDHTVNSESYIAEADSAMYEAKRSGRGNAVIFTDTLRKLAA